MTKILFLFLSSHAGKGKRRRLSPPSPSPCDPLLPPAHLRWRRLEKAAQISFFWLSFSAPSRPDSNFPSDFPPRLERAALMQSSSRPGGGKFRQKASSRGRRERMHEFAGISDFFLSQGKCYLVRRMQTKQTRRSMASGILGKEKGFGDAYNSILCRARKARRK